MGDSYRELQVWKLAMDLAEQCYRITVRFPKEELFGMTSQVRRAASSIPAKIAEGNGRRQPGEYLRFLGIARGSLLELEAHLMLSQRVGLLNEEVLQEALELSNRVGQMLTKLRQAIEGQK